MGYFIDNRRRGAGVGQGDPGLQVGPGFVGEDDFLYGEVEHVVMLGGSVFSFDL
jgi:hypothetical protein